MAQSGEHFGFWILEFGIWIELIGDLWDCGLKTQSAKGMAHSVQTTEGQDFGIWIELIARIYAIADCSLP
jgi:hypothetical protein